MFIILGTKYFYVTEFQTGFGVDEQLDCTNNRDWCDNDMSWKMIVIETNFYFTFKANVYGNFDFLGYSYGPNPFNLAKTGSVKFLINLENQKIQVLGALYSKYLKTVFLLTNHGLYFTTLTVRSVIQNDAWTKANASNIPVINSINTKGGFFVGNQGYFVIDHFLWEMDFDKFKLNKTVNLIYF